MSSNLMDTEAGGEQTQYEGVHTFVKPHAKQTGQFGNSNEGATNILGKTATDEPNSHGITKSDKIRYGQSIQEGGMGGKTANSTGKASREAGFGGTKAVVDEQDGDFAKARREQGYGGGEDMNRNIGA